MHNRFRTLFVVSAIWLLCYLLRLDYENACDMVQETGSFMIFTIVQLIVVVYLFMSPDFLKA